MLQLEEENKETEVDQEIEKIARKYNVDNAELNKQHPPKLGPKNLIATDNTGLANEGDIGTLGDSTDDNIGIDIPELEFTLPCIIL